jgi:hypothetical protein
MIVEFNHQWDIRQWENYGDVIFDYCIVKNHQYVTYMGCVLKKYCTTHLPSNEKEETTGNMIVKHKISRGVLLRRD